MNVEYLFSSTRGDIRLTPEDLARPFLIAPQEQHPFLTIGDYFHGIRRFLLEGEDNPLSLVLGKKLEREIDADGIQRLLIRSEKHGAVYHMASVEAFVNGTGMRLALSTALSERGKTRLRQEYALLKSLNRTLRLPYLPEVYHRGEVILSDGSGRNEILAMLLAQWFEAWHEWHLTTDREDNRQKLLIWDLRRGHRYATRDEAFRILREASKILTLYYDPRDYRQVYPWHHGAGDFIVKTEPEGIDVRLTTVRGYQSVMDRLSGEKADQVTALVYFFLNLSVRMRLDRLDGTGLITWAGDFSVSAAAEGFFEALKIMEGEGRVEPGLAQGLLSILKSFSKDELARLMYPLLALYQEDEPSDFPAIRAGMGGHVSLLHRVLGNLRL